MSIKESKAIEELRVELDGQLIDLPLSKRMEIQGMAVQFYNAGIKKAAQVLIEHIKKMPINEDIEPQNRLGQIDFRDRLLKTL